MDITEEEFEQIMDNILDKLSPEEQEILTSVIDGSEVNNSIVYASIACFLCVLIGLLSGFLFF